MSKKGSTYDVALKKYWGHDKLKVLQKQVIHSIYAEKSDSLVVLRTGYGKSVCFQLPFTLDMSKCVIVVTPLIALMEDQKQCLKSKGIPVIALNSNLKPDIKSFEMSEITDGANKIIYMSPEFIVKNRTFVEELYDDERLAFIAIDEAHCVSSWGNDFRPSYKALGCLKDWMPNVNIMALTATATQKIRDDISKTLQLEDYYEFISSFDRSNLYIECTEKSDTLEEDFAPYVKEYGDKVCIIYARKRQDTENIAKALCKMGINAKAYHAGLNANLRTEIQTEFTLGSLPWIICTNAFGMGIDQNVQIVMHYGSPGDLESYYQEIGRAGRSGEPAKCIMFHGKGDMVVNRMLLKDIKDVEYKKFREIQIKNMEDYVRTNRCRRKVLLKYFGETYKYDNCENCDICTKHKQMSATINHDLRWPMFMFKCFIMHSEIYGGSTKLLNVLMGKKLKPIIQYHSSKFFGLGKRYDIAFWKLIIEVALYNGYVINQSIPSGFGTVILPTDKLKSWYNNAKPILKENKITGFDYDTFTTIAQHFQEIYEIPSTCDDLDRYIRKRTMTVLETSIYDQDIYDNV
jgi:ATP-dependent DNA helicase RecQ